MTSTIALGKSTSDPLNALLENFGKAKPASKVFGSLPGVGEITELAIATPKDGIYSFMSKPKEVSPPHRVATYG